MTDQTPFVMNDAGVALLQNASDASLLVGAQAKTDAAPGFWPFLAVWTYIANKLTIGAVSGLTDALAGKMDAITYTPEDTSNKGQANGYAGLDANAKLPADQLPGAISLDKVTLTTFDNTAPADGELWFDGSNLKFRVGGVTKTVTLT